MVRYGETSDGLAPGVARLRPLIDAIGGYKLSIDQCPECHRLYQCESGYEYLADGSEDCTTYERIDDVEALFHSDWFTRVRIDDRELVGDALQAAIPHARRAVQKLAPRTFFRRHAVVRVALDYGRQHVWLALSDDQPKVTILTGSLGGLALVAAADPPLDLAARAIDYATFIDQVTDERAFQVSTSPDAPRVDVVGDRLVVTRWVVSQAQRIRRTTTIAPDGTARRDDVGE